MDIIADILLFCIQTRTKTSIMYDTNLNYAQLQDLLKFLLAQKMLSLTRGKYATSEKGAYFLDLYFGLLETLIDVE
jgi:predicted transcriptional regulator